MCQMSYGTQVGSEPSTDRAAGRQARVRVDDDVHRALAARDREVVQVRLREHHLAVGRGDVVLPVLPDVALDAEHAAIRGVSDVVLATAAFDVATPDADVREAVPVRVRCRTQHGEHLPLHERVAAVAGHGVLAVREHARRGDLRDRAVVHEHELAVDLGRVRDVVVHERRHRPALVRPLPVVQRAEVVQVVNGRMLPASSATVRLGRCRRRRSGTGRVARPEPPQ